MNQVATIIVTYNGAKWIEKCLQSLLNSTLKSQIILVDNNSTDQTVALLKPFLEKIIFIQSESNLGFGAANNIGIKKAMELGVEYVFLLNQDAYVRKDCVKMLFKTAKAFPEFGILSPVQLSSDGLEPDVTFKNQLSRTVKNFPTITFFEEAASDEIIKLLPARFVGAASWFIPINTIKTVGLFHPVFYHYGEDNNYAARVQYFGFEIGVLSNTAVIHDREQRKDLNKFLPVKLRTFPLHLLLDIRKPLPIAWLTGFYQLTRIKNKLKKLDNSEYESAYQEARSWFFNRMKEVKKLRAGFCENLS